MVQAVGAAAPRGACRGQGGLCQAAVEPGFKLSVRTFKPVTPHGPLRPPQSSPGEDRPSSFLPPRRETKCQAQDVSQGVRPRGAPTTCPATCHIFSPGRSNT